MTRHRKHGGLRACQHSYKSAAGDFIAAESSEAPMQRRMGMAQRLLFAGAPEGAKPTPPPMRHRPQSDTSSSAFHDGG
jgi:hypothetical protein